MRHNKFCLRLYATIFVSKLYLLNIQFLAPKDDEDEKLLDLTVRHSAGRKDSIHGESAEGTLRIEHLVEHSMMI